MSQLLDAGRNFRSVNETGDWLDTLILAIRIDQQLAPSDRRAASAQLTPLVANSSCSHRHLDRLAVLAELVRDDPALQNLRSWLLFETYYQIDPWRKEDGQEQVLARCRALLRLTEALDGMEARFGCMTGWQWRPFARIGMAQVRLGLRQDGARMMDRAIGTVDAIADVDDRLGRLRSLLPLLLEADHDRRVVRDLVDRMDRLSRSMDSQAARELRESLPKILNRGGMDWSQAHAADALSAPACRG